MELALILLLVGLGIGFVGGYLLATHIHSVAAAATSAVVRATTLPGGTNLGLAQPVAEAIANAAQQGATAAIAAAANAAPKPQA